jgi:hypothetical protein
MGKLSFSGKFLERERPDLFREESVSNFYNFAQDLNLKNKRESEHRY